MSARFKSVLLLLVTVGIGMLLGALIQARVAEQRLERLAVLRSERGLARVLERAIAPVDEAQRQAIQEVLASSSQRMAEHIRQNREEAVALLDSTMQALHAVLTEEQSRRLEARMANWERRMPARRGVRRRPPLPHRGPPPR